MNITVLNWFKDFLLGLLARAIEIIFRFLLFFMPLGIYMLVIQLRSKVSSTSNLSVFTTPESVWQHVFPGFILIAVDKNDLRKKVAKANSDFQKFLSNNKYTLTAIFCVVLLILIYVGVRSLCKI